MNLKEQKNIAKLRCITSFITITISLCVLFFISINLGSLKVDAITLLRGLFVEFDSKVATIYDLRFPRIIISMLAGAALATSGTLFQSVLKNPLADPGIIGVCSGAGFTAILVTTLLPELYKLVPFFSFIGGIIAFFLVYSLSSNHGVSPLRILLVGIAIQALFTGLSQSFTAMSGGNLSGAAAIVNGNITMKTWHDVYSLLIYVVPGLIFAIFCSNGCNLLGLEDKTVRGLGIEVSKLRFFISLVAVLLASSVTAVVGVIGFLGLLVPHIGRLLIGNNHRTLLPFSMLLGAFIFLLADTVGRTIAYPYEISAAIIMSVIGGPVFIILLRRSDYINGK